MFPFARAGSICAFLLWLGGLALAAYLTLVHYQPAVLACPTTGLWHCAHVLHSAGSTVGPLPLATWGGLWLILAATVRHYKMRSISRVLGVVGLLGLGWAWFYEWHVHAVCLWCTGLQAIILWQCVLLARNTMHPASPSSPL